MPETARRGAPKRRRSEMESALLLEFCHEHFLLRNWSVILISNAVPPHERKARKSYVNAPSSRRSGPATHVIALAMAGCSLAGWAMGARAADAPPQQGQAATAPAAELTPDLVYAVLAADVATQRGNPRLAFTYYLLAARLAADPSLVQLAARAALALDDRDAEQRVAKLWLELAPDSLEAQQLAAYAALKADDIPVALTHLRRVIVLAHDREKDGYLHAARLLADVQPVQRRLDLLRGLIAEDGETAEAYYALALVAAGAERYDDAVAATRRVLDLKPDWSEPRIFLVRLLLGQNKRVEARNTLEGFVEQYPDDRGLRMLYAQLLVDEREFSSARGVFERMLSKAPKEPDVLFALGILSLQLDDTASARAYFSRLSDTGQRKDDAAFYLGQVEEDAGNADAAVSWYLKVGGDNESDAQVRVARIYAGQGHIERSREVLQRLRDEHADNAIALFLIEAEILKGVGLDQDAMAVYDGALAQVPGNSDLLYARALHAASMDRVDILERDLNAVLGKDPTNAEALNALGYTLADRTDRYPEALGYIQRALEIKPDEAAILDSMGWVQYRLGNLPEALKYLQRAVERTRDGEIAAHLGEVLWALGQRDEAWKVWEGALAEFPDHAYLLKVIGRHRVTSTENGK
jgi:tetratricopeptide (TPR) repeat protein